MGTACLGPCNTLTAQADIPKCNYGTLKLTNKWLCQWHSK